MKTMDTTDLDVLLLTTVLLIKQKTQKKLIEGYQLHCFDSYPFYCTNINSDVQPFQFSSIVSGSPYNLVHKEHSKEEKKQESKTKKNRFQIC
jgi:hypothetical protein